jgi:hypothetical protein
VVGDVFIGGILEMRSGVGVKICRAEPRDDVVPKYRTYVSLMQCNAMQLRVRVGFNHSTRSD